MRLSLTSSASLLAVLTFAGCQGGKATSPALPAATPSTPISYVPAATLLAGGESAAYEGTLGIWTLDIAGTNATLTPARDLAATPGIGSFDVDITDALTRTLCRDCVELKRIELDGNDRPVITIAIRHPFELGDPGNPITAQNRRDLFLFNVKGIIRASNDSEIVNGITLPTKVLNDPDGYYFNEGLFADSPLAQDAYPYLVFGVDQFLTGTGNFNATTGQFDAMDAPTGFNVIGQGQSATAAFTFDVDTGETISLDLVLVAQYGQSVENKAQRMSPEYYAAEFSAGPWRVDIDEFATPFGTAPGSPQATSVRVWDFAMAHGNFDAGFPSVDYLGTSWNPDLSVELFIPEFRATPFVPSDAPTGTGAIGDPLIYSITADNQLGIANGNYTGLLKVTSNRPVGAANPGEADDVSGIGADLDATNLIPISEIATYLPIDIAVSTVVGLPPVADLSSSKMTVMVGNGAYFFPGPGTTDPDGTIMQYVYDGDWDGVPSNFTPDVIMTTADPVAIRFPAVGTTTVGLRVRDNDNNYGYDSLGISVNPIGDPFPPAQSPQVLISSGPEQFNTSDHNMIAVDYNHPGNVYLFQDGLTTSSTNFAIYRSKNYGATWDTGTIVQTVLTTKPGNGCGWASGRSLTVLGDGSLGILMTATQSTGDCPDGRGTYYAWVDADPAGIGVDASTSDLIRVTAPVGVCGSHGDSNLLADTVDPTRAHVVSKFLNSSCFAGGDQLFYHTVLNANTPGAVASVGSKLVSETENKSIDNPATCIDPATNFIHIAWEETNEIAPLTNYLCYSRIVANNPVGPPTRAMATSLIGLNNTVEHPSIAVTTNGQPVLGFRANWNSVAPAEYDVALVKIMEPSLNTFNFGAVQRYTLTGGQGYGALVGDRTTGRLTYAIHTGPTSATGNTTRILYNLIDSNLVALLPTWPELMLTDPGSTWQHDYPQGCVDPNTGSTFIFWNEDKNPLSATPDDESGVRFSY